VKYKSHSMNDIKMVREFLENDLMEKGELIHTILDMSLFSKMLNAMAMVKMAIDMVNDLEILIKKLENNLLGIGEVQNGTT
jgi:hypothetical protein